MKKKLMIWGLCLLSVVNGSLRADDTSTRRFGIFVGSNNGGRDRTMLRYAVSDAKAVSKVFAEMGGILGKDNIIVIEPDMKEINRLLDHVQAQMLGAKQTHTRTELVFYYSGHADETGLLLGRERYAYKDLRDRINQIQSDMRIVILDSCSSGSFTRAKGGRKTQPFLVDSSSSAEGYAFLTSSAATEASQESDTIESSYFTHSLVAGLRGAADTIGDGRVTLNEAYRFVYAETLAKTETSLYGAQHPSYDIQINGTGDVVLTDIKETSSSLLIDETITGRLSIRDSSDYLVAEITKTSGKPLELGLEPGVYRITLQQGDTFYRTEIYLSNQRVILTKNDFRPIAASPAMPRGEISAFASSDEEVPVEPVTVQFVPGFGFGSWKATNNVILGILAARGYNLKGIGFSTLGLINTGSVYGVQGSGIFNIAANNMFGAQGAGVFNIIGSDFQGVQGAGIFNITGNSGKGAQGAGVFNIIGSDLQGVQGAGIFNITGNSGKGVQGAGVFNIIGSDFQGIQGAGVFNISSRDFRGAQGAGLFNIIAGDLNGIQAAGLFNIASGDTYGLQVGLLNRGGRGAGVQIGLINISDNTNVVPIGLVNVVKDGILHPALYYDDMGFINVSFRSGSQYLYTLLSAGTRGITVNGNRINFGRDFDDELFVYRTGLGFEIPLGNMFMDLDITWGGIIDFTKLENDDSIDFAKQENEFLSFTGQARLTIGYKLFEHLGIFGGISYNFIHRLNDNSPNPDSNVVDLSWNSDPYNQHKLGFFAGVQF